MMEKRLRDCIRHMENLDYNALSQEDMERERKEFLIQMGFLQHEFLCWQIWAGVFVICLLKTGLPFIGLQNQYQQFITGFVLIIAVFADVANRKKKSK